MVGNMCWGGGKEGKNPLITNPPRKLEVKKKGRKHREISDFLFCFQSSHKTRSNNQRKMGRADMVLLFHISSLQHLPRKYYSIYVYKMFSIIILLGVCLTQSIDFRIFCFFSVTVLARGRGQLFISPVLS